MASPRFKLCIVHIGTEKTGTTTIQRFLADNRRHLARDGVLYPVAGGREGSQWGYAACALDQPWTTDLGREFGIDDAAGLAAFRTALQSALDDEAAAHPACDTLLISSEHLHSRVTTPEAIGRLKAFLEPYAQDFAVVLYVRRQDRMAVSRFSTALKVGFNNPRVFPRPRQTSLPYYFDFERIYHHWESVFGQPAMRVRIFEQNRFEGGELLMDFCAACGLDRGDKSIPARANESLDQAGLHFLREVNNQLPRMLGARVNPVRVGLAGVVSTVCAGSCTLATRSEALEFYAQFRPGNERLAAVVFGKEGQALFDEDFTDYPESLENVQPRYEDAVKIAIRLWLHKLDAAAPFSTIAELESVVDQLRQMRAENAYLQAEIALRDGDVAASRSHLHACLQHDARHGRAHLALARQFLETGNPVRGMEHLRDARACLGEACPELESLSARYPPGTDEPSRRL